jgi:hypothetical protein
MAVLATFRPEPVNFYYLPAPPQLIDRRLINRRFIDRPSLSNIFFVEQIAGIAGKNVFRRRT